MLSTMSNRFSKLVRVAYGLLGACALVMTSCGGGSADTAVEASPLMAEPTPAGSSLVASTVGGGQIDFGSFEGQDVVLWFWAPW